MAFGWRGLANTMFIKTQIYWIHVPKSPKSIGLLLGEWCLYLEYGPQMSLLREETVQSLGAGSLLLTATPRHLNELENSELGTETLRDWHLPPEHQIQGWTKQWVLSPEPQPSSALLLQHSLAHLQDHKKCAFFFESWKYQIWSGPKWVAKFLKILTQALYLWVSAIIWTGERQKWDGTRYPMK